MGSHNAKETTMSTATATPPTTVTPAAPAPAPAAPAPAIVPAAPAAPPLSNTGLIAAIDAATPGTVVDPDKLTLPASLLTADDRRLFAYVMAVQANGEVALAWRKRHANIAAGVPYWRWAISRLTFGGDAAPQAAIAAEAETRRLLESRRLRAELRDALGRVAAATERVAAAAEAIAPAVASAVAVGMAVAPDKSRKAGLAAGDAVMAALRGAAPAAAPASAPAAATPAA